MAYQMKTALAQVPSEPLDPQRQPRFGGYQGSFGAIDLAARLPAGVRGRFEQLKRRKRWQYGLVATQEVLCAFAIVDVGYAANGFVFAVDLATGLTLADHSYLGVPQLSAQVGDRPGAGAHSSFRAPGCRMEVSRPAGSPSFEVRVHAGSLTLDAVLDQGLGPDPLAVVMPVKGGDVSCTQKACLLPVAGSLVVGDRRFALGGGLGGLDYTHGLLARLTSWRWAFGLGRAQDGTAVGFNLAEGLTEQSSPENAVWVGKQLFPVGQPRFTYDAKQPNGPWQVRTDDGVLDLKFQARGMHREDRDLVLVQSHFAQVAGLFSGTVRTPDGRTLELEALPGVTEDQRVYW